MCICCQDDKKMRFFFSTVGHIYMKDMQNKCNIIPFFAYTLKLKPNLWDLHLIWISAKKSAIMVIRKDHELKARVIIFEYLNFIWCVKQQPYFSGKKLIPVAMKTYKVTRSDRISWNSWAIFKGKHGHKGLCVNYKCNAYPLKKFLLCPNNIFVTENR